MAFGGALDLFNKGHRAQYFSPSGKYETLIEHALRYGNAYQQQSEMMQNSLFGGKDIAIEEPKFPEVKEWSLIFKLTKEKEVTGIYMTGHPLDDYRLEVDNFTNCPLDLIERYKDRKLKVAGIVTNAQHRVSKKGTGWGLFTLEDFRGSLELRLFNEDYKKYKSLFEPGEALYVEGLYQQGWNGGSYRFVVSQVKLLDSIGETMTESITLQIPVENLDDSLVQQIDSICNTNKGSHKLKLQVYDREEDVMLNLVSRKCRVKANGEFVEKLSKLGVKYKLN
jgi:DNA polymerase-3 subunit alpha